MKHSTTYPFRRWYRRPLTPRESAVIGLLERRRRRTGRVSIVLTVSAACSSTTPCSSTTVAPSPAPSGLPP